MVRALILLLLLQLPTLTFSKDKLTVLFKANVSNRTFMNVVYSQSTFNKNFQHDKGVGVNLIANIDSLYEITIEADSISGLGFIFYNKRVNPKLLIHSIELVYNNQDTLYFNKTQVLNEFNLTNVDLIKEKGSIKIILNKTSKGRKYSRINLEGNSIKKFYAITQKKEFITDTLMLNYKTSAPVHLELYYNSNDRGPYNLASTYLWPKPKVEKIFLPILNEGEIGDFRIELIADSPYTLQLNEMSIKGVDLSPNKMKRLFNYSSFNSFEVKNNSLVLQSQGRGSLIFKYGLEYYNTISYIIFALVATSILLYFINRFSLSKNYV